MIQWLSSHLLAGKVKGPMNVPPAWIRIVSPQRALSSAFCRLPPSDTEVARPGAGVSARELWRYTRGSSAGPSKLAEETEGLTVRLNAWFTLWEFVSVTEEINLKVPVCEVVPEIMPLL